MSGARFALAGGALLAAAAHAQVVRPPDAGSIQRDLEQRQLEVPREAPPLPAAPVRPAKPADASQRFTVAALRVSGNTTFPAETLLALVRDDLVGRSVTLRDLQNAAAKITTYYRERGHVVARAYIPAQRIAESGAEVEIAVLEGALGRLELDNRSRLSDTTVARFAAPLAPGAPLTAAVLDRPLLLLSDQAGVAGIVPVLGPGEREGTSDLALELAPAALFSGQVEFDDYGSRSTGRYRLSGQVNVLSPLGLGESVNARVTESFEGLTSVSLRAAVPLGGDGWKLGGSYSYTHYRLGGDFEALQASGEASGTGAQLSYAVVRSQRWNLNATLAHEERRFEDRQSIIELSVVKRTRAASLTLAGDWRDPLAANSVAAWSVSLADADLAIEHPDISAVDAATAQTQGDYRKVSYSALYLQSLDARWSVYGSLLGQIASKNLDSSEKLALGGPQGVRAYPLGEAPGDEGALGTLELRYALAPWHGVTPTLAAFADYGRVRFNKNPFAPGPNSRSLGAAGLGATVSKDRDFSLRLSWAAKTSGGPATADDDRDSRVWVQLAKFF